MSAPLLEVDDLHVDFNLHAAGTLQAVRGVSFSVPAGRTVALVGESGSGKSVVSQAILGILPKVGRISRGRILFRDPEAGEGAAALDIAAQDPDGPVLRSLRARTDSRKYNGASLVGLNGIVIKSHGGADSVAFQHAIETALVEVRNQVPRQIGSLLKQEAA